MLAIAIDRYRAITEPITYGANRSLFHVVLSISTVWVVSIVAVCPPYVEVIFGRIWKLVWPEKFDKETACSVPQVTGQKSQFLRESFLRRVFQIRSYAIYGSLVCFYIPLMLIISIYIRLFFIGRKRLRDKMKRTQEQLAILTHSSAHRSTTGENVAIQVTEEDVAAAVQAHAAAAAQRKEEQVLVKKLVFV